MSTEGSDVINKLESVYHYLFAIADKQTMALYVDRAIQMLKEQENAYRYLLKQFVEVQDQLNTKPDIVRCKDCWKREFDNCPFNEHLEYKPEDDFFCADGERKEIK